MFEPGPLTPDQPAAVAVVAIARGLLQVMRDNLPAIRRDAASESLHDFRVALRRLRSLIGLHRDVFPAPVVARFVPAFREIGAATGALRDLEVALLLRRDDFPLPAPELPPGLAEFFEILAERRRRAWLDVVAFLDGDRFRQTIKDWADFLDQPPARWADLPARAETPIKELAAQKIRERHLRLLRHGSGITAESPDRSLHKLRIQCKKLRYSLEFYGPLFPADECSEVLRQLKALQRNLGEFNDLSVQTANLRSWLTRSPDEPLSPLLEAALGAVSAQLDASKERARRDIVGVYAAFAGEQTRETVARLLRTPG